MESLSEDRDFTTDKAIQNLCGYEDTKPENGTQTGNYWTSKVTSEMTLSRRSELKPLQDGDKSKVTKCQRGCPKQSNGWRKQRQLTLS